MNAAFAPSGMSLHRRSPQPGWVEYHDVGHMANAAGLAMTWRSPDGPIRFVAVMDRERDGRVTLSGTVGDLQDVAGCVSQAWHDRSFGPPEEATLRLMFPHVSPASPTHVGSGLPPLGEHAALARRAVAEGRLPTPMRAALVACLDKGAPRSAAVAALRMRSHSTLWPALALSMTDPGLFDIVAAADPSILGEAVPLAAIRRRWPGLTAAHIGRMRQRDAFPASWRTSGRTTPTLCLDLLAACPVDWWPREGDWIGFIACAQALKAIGDILGAPGSLRDLASPSKGDWQAYGDRLCRAAGVKPSGHYAAALAQAAMSCLDPVRSMASGATLPLLAELEDDDGLASLEGCLGRQAQGGRTTSPVVGAAFALAGRLLYGDKSAAAIMEASREWHARRQAMDSKVRVASRALAWPALFDGTFRDGGLGIVAITTHEGLRDEGWDGEDRNGVQGLHHCVATRLAECLAGRAHVLSVRTIRADGTWERLSTCEIGARVDEDGGPHLRVREHKGLGNAAPDPAAVAAVSRLTSAITAGHIDVSEAALSPRRPSRSLEDVCGYDWRDPAAIANAFEAWRPFVPRWCRDLGPDDLRRALAERGMIAAPEAPERSGPHGPRG